MTETKHRQPLAAREADQPIDLVGFARETTKKDISRLPKGTIKILAPAKVNLLLGIGARRDDGYHDVTTVMHALMLHDVLYMHESMEEDLEEQALVPADCEAAGAEEYPFAPRVRVFCAGTVNAEAPCVAPEHNLVCKAVRALARELAGEGAAENPPTAAGEGAENASATADEGAMKNTPVAKSPVRTDTVIEIRIEKNIPSQAGLGGGSSDAAAALLGAATLWGVALDHPALERAAQTLGSDVAFFLRGGCALMSGTGEVFERALTPRKESVVVVQPEAGLSTADVYRTFDQMESALDEAACAQARKAARAAEVPLYNNLQEPACALLPELSQIIAWAQAHESVSGVLLSGSGSAVFVVCETFNQASALTADAKQHGWWARATTFSSLKAAVVPC